MSNLDYRQLRANMKAVGFKPQPFIFAEHVQKNGGLLPDQIGAHACWYYCYCANVNLEKVREGASYEGETDHVESLNNIARSIAAIYDLESPSEFLKFMGDVRLEAIRCRLMWDVRIEEPLKSQFRTRGT